MSADKEIANLREQLLMALRQAKYWKAEHLAGNERIAALESALEALKAAIDSAMNGEK
jgi:hypothetical protein